MTLKKKQKHTKTMHIIFVITLINCMVKVSYANAITATSPQEVEIGGDVTLEWTLMPSTGKQVNAITLSRLLDSEDTLWRSAAKNVAGTGVDERFVKLKNVLGDRVTIEEVTRKGFEIFKLSIKSLNFSDSIVLNVKASFGPAGDFPTHEGFVNKTIVLKVVGLELISESLKSSYTYEEDATPTFSIILAADPPPTVSWKLENMELANTVSGNPVNVASKQYQYSYKLSPLKAKDCGTKLTYQTSRAYGGKILEDSATLDVKFTPEKVQVTSFNFISIENKDCEKVIWNPVAAGKCGDRITYTVEIKNGSQSLIYPDIKETSLTTCNATNASNTKVYATYEGTRNGEVSDIVLFVPKPLTTTLPPSTTTTVKDTGITASRKSDDSDDTGAIIGGAIGGLVVLILIVVLIVFIVKKKGKKNGGIDSGEEEMHLEDWHQNQKENHYSSVEKPSKPKEDPNQAIYSELGPGGRSGPKPNPANSNYAEVKVDEHGFPISGDPLSPVEKTPYDQVQRHSDDDFDTGIIV